MRRSREARHFRTGLGFAITALCLGVLAYRVDFGVLTCALAAAEFRWMAVGVLALTLGYALRIERWAVLLRATGAPVSAKRAWAPFLASIAMNNVLPLRAGDVVRAMVFPAAIGVSRAVALASLLIERALDIGALALMACLGIALASVTAVLVPLPLRTTLLILAAMVAGALIAGPLAAARIGHKLAAGTTRFAVAAANAVAAMGAMTSPRLLCASVALTVGCWLAEAGLYLAVLRALDIPVGIWEALAVCGVVTFVTIVPSSPGYVGTFHAAAFGAALALGANEGDAAAFAVLSHAALWIPTTLAGGIALLTDRSLLKQPGS